MKKKLLALLLALGIAFALAACSGQQGAQSQAPGGQSSAPSGGTISLRVWGAEEDQALLATLIDDFKATYSDYTFDIRIGVESESTAKDTVLTDISAAADVFAFADDQLAALVSAGALANLEELAPAIEAVTGKTLGEVKAANSASSVEAATSGDTLYAFPMGGGNNCFLFYDSTVLSEEDVASWDNLLTAAQAAGKRVGMTLASGWYNASFFLGAGFYTALNEDGSTSLDWNGTSADGYTGVQVVESMLNIAGHPAFMAVAEGDLSNQIASGALCAAVDGTWDAGTAQLAWGEGYAATKLPTFTLNGQQVQQGCYSGFKLMGVNSMSNQAGWAAILAEFLTNETSQVARFESRQLAPTNLVAASNEAVTANVAIAASSLQDAYGVVQSVGDKYWDPAATFGEIIAQGQLKPGDTAGIQAALDTLVEGVTAPLE